VHQRGQDVPPDVEVYVPYTLETWGWGSLIVRARDGARTIPALARAVRSVDSRLVAPGPGGDAAFGMMESTVASSLQSRRFSMSLVAGFAVCALLVAAIGMYGVVSYSVAQRTQEIGVRKALGATDGDIRSLVVRDALRIVALGILFGGAGAWAGGRLIRSLLFETGIADPTAYLVAAAVLSGVALLATYGPARRAIRLAPTTALSTER
jgi:putative ABC transport system permease protein